DGDGARHRAKLPLIAAFRGGSVQPLSVPQRLAARAGRECGGEDVHRLDRPIRTKLHAGEASLALESAPVRNRVAVVDDIPAVGTWNVYHAVMAGSLHRAVLAQDHVFGRGLHRTVGAPCDAVADSIIVASRIVDGPHEVIEPL